MSESYAEFLARRREEILGVVADAAARAGRSMDELLVEAVSKTVGPEQVAAAWQAGWRTFAENRPQELVRKTSAASEVEGMESVRFDMIGNLQRNKINQVLGRAALVHSISSEHLCQGVANRAEARGLVQPVLLEVNVSGEGTKSGFAPDAVREALPRMLELGGVQIRGLMTMAPAGDPDAARRTFCGLRELRDELERACGAELPELSCGMSDDFAIAVEEGSTILRLGRVVFDPEHAVN